jgi:hypothetical protein
MEKEMKAPYFKAGLLAAAVSLLAACGTPPLSR